ncbi:hypothetical protein BDY19DRAFT_990588 [Irpex rosettiformis]|uniref:Uncharacterized protein n=1 Tax=Irpex rosettiformis TaxID=378272 RepID=A0ACB8UEW9_9APHY|nr:hypothetical protein BDY19DRAFT_990588 [Irpex rosettiformis]
MTSTAHKTNTPISNAGASSSTEQSIGSNFRRRAVEVCEGYISQFSRGEKSKVDVIKSLYTAIFSNDDNGEELEFEALARNASFSNFLEKVEEICQSHSAAGMRGRAIEVQPIGKAVHEVKDTAENEEEVERARSVERGRGASPSATKSSKKPFIKAILSFIANRQTCITEDDLRPELRETLRCKGIYARDITATKNVVICQPDCPQIPNPIWSNILLSKFVDLDRVFSVLHSIEGDAAETYKVGDLELTARPTKPKKHVASTGKWSIAFECYK